MTRRCSLALNALCLLVALLGLQACSRDRSILEHLDHPVEVMDWGQSGLHLADGRTVTLPGIQELPVSSKLLSAMLSRGVEVQSDGRVFGLIDVHHWCGNDEIQRHVARVDVGRLLQFAGEVHVAGELDAEQPGPACDDVGPYGLNVTCFYGFTDWLATRLK